MTVAHDLPASLLAELLFDEPGVGRCLVAPDGTVLRANAEWLRSTGFSLEEVLGADLVALFPESREMALALHARARAGHRVEVPRHVQRLQGRETWWDGTIAPVPMQGGTGLLVTAREVSTAERGGFPRDLVSRDPELVRAVLDTVANLVVVLDPAGTILGFNEASERATGYAAAEVLGKSVFEQFVPPDELASTRAIFERLRAGDFPNRHQNRWRARDGSERLFEWANTCTLDEHGRVKYVIGTATDVTDRVRGEQALRESTSLLRAVSDSSGDVIFAKDRDGRLRFANPATLALVGKPLEQVLGRTDVELLDDADAARQVMQNDRRIMEAGRAEDVEEVVPSPDGTRRIWLSRKSPYRDESGRVIGLLGISRDITQRKRDSEALRESERRLRAAHERLRAHVESTPLALVEWDSEYRVVGYSGRAEELFGWTSEEVLGKRIDEIPWIPEADWPSVRAVMRDMSSGARPTNVNANRNVRKDGGVVYCEWYNSTIHDEGGRLVSVLSLVLDVTARYEAEQALRDGNERLVEADRRKTEFLAVLSHELRNPLAPIRNGIHLLERAPSGSDVGRRALEVLRRQADHLARLVDDLLDVTRITHGKIELQVERLDARDVARRAWEDARALFDQRGVELLLSQAVEPLWVDADAARLSQIIGNLLHNALKFTPSGGRVRVGVDRRRGACEVSVSDTGLGIEAGDLERIFDAFVQSERTRRGHGGMGLGLALVRDLASRMGGAVRARSAGPGQGAEFSIELPLTTPPPHRCAPSRDEQLAAGASVLIVEDNEDAAVTLAELLELGGHHVRTAGTGGEGIAAATADAPDVLICDLGLPDMSGLEVIRAIRAAPAGAGVFAVALTGYAQPQDRAEALAAGFDAHLPKPPPLEQLEQLLRDGAARRAPRGHPRRD